MTRKQNENSLGTSHSDLAELRFGWAEEWEQSEALQARYPLTETSSGRLVWVEIRTEQWLQAQGLGSDFPPENVMDFDPEHDFWERWDSAPERRGFRYRRTTRPGVQDMPFSGLLGELLAIGARPRVLICPGAVEELLGQPAALGPPPVPSTVVVPIPEDVDPAVFAWEIRGLDVVVLAGFPEELSCDERRRLMSVLVHAGASSVRVVGRKNWEWKRT